MRKDKEPNCRSSFGLARAHELSFRDNAYLEVAKT